KAEAAAAGAKVAESTGMQIVEVTTSKGKVLRGVLRPDLTLQQAKAIDSFTWQPKGMRGFFIREQHLAALQKAHPRPGAATADFSLSRGKVASSNVGMTPAYASDGNQEHQRVVERTRAAIASLTGSSGYALNAIDGPSVPRAARAARSL